jgi:hypothetical protein
MASILMSKRPHFVRAILEGGQRDIPEHPALLEQLQPGS